MTLSHYSVKRPVTVVVLFALVLIVAGVMIPRIAVDLFPSISRPVISVSTGYSGAGPEEVEANVTEPDRKSVV